MTNMDQSQTRISCLGIATSPRVGGNTSILLDKALEGAAEAGAVTEKISLNNFSFRPCIACDGCMAEGKCVVKDDMQLIYPKLLAADRIILAAPIYSMGMCAQAKAMVDRTQRFWATKYVLKKPVIPDKDRRPARRGMFLSAAGTNYKNVFDGALRVAKYFFMMLEAEFAGSHCFHEIDAKGAVQNFPDVLNEAHSAGYNLIQAD